MNIYHNNTEKVGGQAVIEGVMMRCKNKLNTSVRKDGKIISKKKVLKKKNWFWKIFLIRGISNMYDMLKIGIDTLVWSAEQQAEEDEKISKSEMNLTLFFSFAIAILLFIVAPFYMTKFLYSKSGFLFNVIDGIIRLGVFFVYLLIISKMEDIQTLFKYHGAEHKTVHCYEAGKELTVKNVKKFSTLHPRCGTSFLVIVLFISIIVFSFITSDKWYYKLGLRILLIPVIIGFSYEILKLADKMRKNKFFDMLNKPGLWIQKITTKEPTDKQIEVAIDSLKKVI